MALIKQSFSSVFSLPTPLKVSAMAMAKEEYLPESRLRWNVGWDKSEPLWPRDPDIETIRLITADFLGCDPTTVDVQFFAEGALNKLYEIRELQPRMPFRKPLLLRVTLPIDPCYKTASEVGTLTFLRSETSVPVPSVFAFDSNCNNALGFEWMLVGENARHSSAARVAKDAMGCQGHSREEHGKGLRRSLVASVL